MDLATAKALKVGDILVATEKLVDAHGKQWEGEFVFVRYDAGRLQATREGVEHGKIPRDDPRRQGLWGDFLLDYLDLKERKTDKQEWVLCTDADIGKIPNGTMLKLVDTAGLSNTVNRLEEGKLYELVRCTEHYFKIEDGMGESRTLLPRRFRKLVGKAPDVRVTNINQLQPGMKVKLVSLEELMKPEGESGYVVGLSIGMKAFANTEVTITKVHERWVNIDIDNDRYCWNPTWFIIPGENKVKAPSFKEGDKVVVAKRVESAKCKWLEEMDECLNEPGVVLSVSKEKFYEVETASGVFFYVIDALMGLVQFKHGGGKLKFNAIIAEKSMKQKAADWLSVHNHGTAVSRFARFGIKDNDVIVEGHANGPCHAGLSYQWHVDKVLGILDVPYMSEKDPRVTDIDEYKTFVDYLVNRSPFSVAYLKGQTADNILQEGVWMDVKQHANVLASACIALRHGTEHHTQVESFSWFLKQGFEEAVAYLASWMVRVDKKGNVVKGNIGGGHMVFSCRMNITNLVKFVKHGVFHSLVGKTYENLHFNYRVFPSIDPLADQWADHNAAGVTVDAFINKNFQQIVEGKGFAAKVSYTTQSAIDFANALKKEFENA